MTLPGDKNFYHKGTKYAPYSNLSLVDSAFFRLSRNQFLFCLTGSLFYLLLLYTNWLETLVFTFAFLTLVYFTDLFFSLFLVMRSFVKKHEVTVSQKEIDSVPDSEWPLYTVFCPLYKEYEVVPQFIEAMNQLYYPKDKLQIMFLLEENDQETLQHINSYNLPDYFETVVIPHSLPKTKPKALNYGLLKAKGKYAVIYDAEDIPDKDQLKKVILGFRKLDKSVGCIQAKLNFYNPDQNILTKIFTAEYSLWFDLVLTGLQSINAPIPLGGTSNHFRTADLITLKGWDSFNVTEDCDLGMRLAKKGLRTAIIDSTTLEEANSEITNWFWQRSRWIKGYIQTYLQHLRTINQFPNTWKKPNALIFQLIIGGKLLSTFFNPLLWIITTSYFVFYDYIRLFIEQFFPFLIIYMAVISLVIGNFLYMVYYMLACSRYGHHRLVKYMYLVPLYWLAMSLAGWVALYQFIIRPHHWAKTKHGLHLNRKKIILKKNFALAYIETFQTRLRTILF